MLYKEDWREAQERWKAWWDGEIIDRVAITIDAPRTGLNPNETPSWATWDFCRYPLDPEMVIRRFEGFCSNTHFGGEAFPNLWINLGGPILAAYMGSQVEFRSDTVWFNPLGGWDKLLDVRFDPANEHWKLTKRLTEISVERGKGRFIVGMTDLGGACEALGMLRGVKNFAVDLFTREKELKALLERLQEVFFYCYEELYQIMLRAASGMSSWVGTWSPKRMFTLDHDLVVYMSPEKFRIFELPYIQEECNRFEHTIYHLDGALALHHLDSLLSVPELGGIQWVPEPGQPGCESSEWMPMYRKIQKAGKLLVLSVPEDSVRSLLRELSSRGLLLRTSCRSEEKARALLESLSSP